MKKIVIAISIISVGIAVSCKSKKATTTSTTTSTSTPVTTSPTGSSAASPNGIMMPTNEQVLAVRAKYPDVTVDELKEGYKIYTGVCTNCHGAKSIYKRDEAQWQHIIDDMAPKASLTALQTAQLTKYVFSIKASQPKTN